MAERVVDRFETIEVNKQYGECRRLALAAADGSLEMFRKRAAVWQARELVVLGPFLKLVCSTSAVRDVAKCNNAAKQFTIAVKKTLTVEA